MTGRFSKKAKRHARQSRMGTKRMLAEAPKRSGPVEVYFECPISGGPHAKADHRKADDPFEEDGGEVFYDG